MEIYSGGRYRSDQFHSRSLRIKRNIVLALTIPSENGVKKGNVLGRKKRDASSRERIGWGNDQRNADGAKRGDANGKAEAGRRAYLDLNFALLPFAGAVLVISNPNLDKGKKRNVSHPMYTIGRIWNVYRVQLK
jgi:hypothetical protein